MSGVAGLAGVNWTNLRSTEFLPKPKEKESTEMELGDLIRIWIVIIVVGVCILVVRKVTPKDSIDDFSPIDDPTMDVSPNPTIAAAVQEPSAVEKSLTIEQVALIDLAHDVKRIKNLLEWFWILSVLGAVWGALWLFG